LFYSECIKGLIVGIYENKLDKKVKKLVNVTSLILNFEECAVIEEIEEFIIQ
jgi:hypothetical protein